MLQSILEYLAIACFIGLSIISGINKQWDFMGLNLSLVFLYLFLYVQPFSKLIK